MKKISILLLLSISLLLNSCKDKKVIAAFGYMNEKLEESNQVLTLRNEVYQQLLASKIEEDPKKYKSIKERADRVEQISSEFYNFIEDLKDTIFNAHFEHGEDRSDYSKLSDSKYLDQLFFTGENASTDGQKFLSRINQFKQSISTALGRGFASISSLVNARFRIEDIEVRETKIPWLNLKFKGFPAITSITNLSQMQTDIQLVQSELLSSMISGEFERELAMRNFVGIVQLNKNAYLQGERVKGKILLGRFDTSVTPENVIVNGVKVKEQFLKEGEISLNFRANGVGEHPLAGVFTVMEEGEPVQIRFSSSYSVIRKYRYEGSDPTNPVAGTPVSNVPETPAFDETKARLNGSIRNEFGYLRLSKRTLSVSTIGAIHFDSNTKYKAVSFSINFDGKRNIKIRGNKLDSRAKKLVSKLRKGQRVKIFDIVVTSSTGGRLRNIEPINIKIKN